MKIIVTRHTTTDWNAAGRIQGQTDIELNERGRTEAARLAKALSGTDIKLIVSSDLHRASQTAEIINSALRTKLKLEPKLRECCFGGLEGLTQKQAIGLFGPAVARQLDDQNFAYDFHPFGGENRAEVLARHLAVMASFKTLKLGDAAVLLVGHSRGMSTLLADLGYPPKLKRGEARFIEFHSGEPDTLPTA